MPKNNSLIIGLIVLALLMGGGFAKQLTSNQELKDEITQNQEEADSRISDLEKELNEFKTEENSPQAPTKFIKEEDLLADFFAVAPTVITGDEIKEATSETKTGPSLLVTPEVFDFGQISKADGIATATYTLENNGSKPLTISYAFSSCGCTVAPLKDEKILQPGESFPLEVAYDPNFYGPQYELGSIEKTVTILSNYVTRPFYKVKLKANITP